MRPAEYIAATYQRLRLIMVILGLALPVVLAVGGIHYGMGLRPSLSDYYNSGVGWMRDWLVGSLFVVGGALIAYKGYTEWEDLALNVGGVLLVAVALVPTPATLHQLAAVGFFICIGYVCVFQSGTTLSLVKNDTLRSALRQIYRVLGVLMILIPLTVYVLGLVTHLWGATTFFLEAGCVLIFSIFWAVKSFEIAKTDADQKTAHNKVLLKAPPTRTMAFFGNSRLEEIGEPL